VLLLLLLLLVTMQVGFTSCTALVIVQQYVLFRTI
jgi:hypothetical protein